MTAAHIVRDAGTALAVIAVIAAVWRKFVIPIAHLVEKLVHAFDTFERVAPVLVKIGEEFHENGGSSLKDTLNRMEATLAAKAERLEELHDYSHRWRHDQSNQMAKLVLADEVIFTKLDAIAAGIDDR